MVGGLHYGLAYIVIVMVSLTALTGSLSRTRTDKLVDRHDRVLRSFYPNARCTVRNVSTDIMVIIGGKITVLIR